MFDGARTDGRGYGPDEQRSTRSTRTARRRRRRAAAHGRRTGDADARLAIVADLVAPRAAGQRLPREDRPPPRSGREAAGEPLKAVGDEIGTPTYTPRRRRRDRRADRRGRADRRRRHGGRSTTSSTAAARPGPTGRARSCGRPASTSTVEEVPGVHLAARVARRRCGRSSSPRRCPSGEPMRDWRVAFADAVPALRGRSRRADRRNREATPVHPHRPRHTRHRTGPHPAPTALEQRRPERASRVLTIPRLARRRARGEAGQALIPRPARHRAARPPHRSPPVAHARPRPRRRLPRRARPRSRRVAAPAAARRRPAQGRDHRRARPTASTAEVPRRTRTRSTPRRSSTRRTSCKVYSPNATLAKVQGRGQRRVDRRLPGPRQRLAEPVHVRPQLHDQGRLRAQRRPQRRRQAQRLREQVLRRAVDPDADAGPERRRPAVPPLLRLGQLRAGRRRPEPDDREEARRQLRARRSSGPAPAPSSRTATATTRTTSTALFTTRQTIDELLAQRARLRTTTSRTYASTAQPGLHVPAGSRRPGAATTARSSARCRSPRPRTSPARRSPTRAATRPASSSPATRRPAFDGAPRLRLGRVRGGRRLRPADARCSRPRRSGSWPRRGSTPADGSAVLPGPHRRRLGRLDARLDAAPARQRRARRSGRSTTAAGVFSPNGDGDAGRAGRSTSTCPSPPPGRSGSATATATSRRTPAATGDTAAMTWAPRRLRRRRRPTAGSSRRPTAGATARSRRTARSRSTPGAGAVAGRRRCRRRAVVHPQRRRLPRDRVGSPARRTSPASLVAKCDRRRRRPRRHASRPRSAAAPGRSPGTARRATASPRTAATRSASGRRTVAGNLSAAADPHRGPLRARSASSRPRAPCSSRRTATGSAGRRRSRCVSCRRRRSTWTVVDTERRRRADARRRPADGRRHPRQAWDGRDDGGAFVPRGTYSSRVSVTDGTHAAVQRVAVVADAFRMASSATRRRAAARR